MLIINKITISIYLLPNGNYCTLLLLNILPIIILPMKEDTPLPNPTMEEQKITTTKQDNQKAPLNMDEVMKRLKGQVTDNIEESTTQDN